MVLGEESEGPRCVDDVCAEKGRVEGEYGGRVAVGDVRSDAH